MNLITFFTFKKRTLFTTPDIILSGTLSLLACMCTRWHKLWSSLWPHPYLLWTDWYYPGGGSTPPPPPPQWSSPLFLILISSACQQPPHAAMAWNNHGVLFLVIAPHLIFSVCLSLFSLPLSLLICFHFPLCFSFSISSSCLYLTTSLPISFFSLCIFVFSPLLSVHISYSHPPSFWLKLQVKP